jgi:hypothetical protein
METAPRQRMAARYSTSAIAVWGPLSDGGLMGAHTQTI